MDFPETLPACVPDRGSSLRSRNKTARQIRDALAEVRRRYRYSAIGEDATRLLIVHPPKNGPEEIEVELKEVPYDALGSDIEFEALSYHWGGEQEVRALVVRSDSHQPHVSPEQKPSRPRSMAILTNTVLSKKLWVKANLYRALRYLRVNDRPIALWVDAVCINQDDFDEKERQVARMVDIYSRAARVLIWLGDEDRRCRNAIKFVQDLVQVEDVDKFVASYKTVTNWSDLVHLMQRPWFSRRWVIQEMAYAKTATVHFADLALPWDDFRDAVSLFVLNIDKIRSLLQPLLELSTGLGNGLLLHENLGSLDFLLQNKLDGLPAKVFIDVLDYMFRKPKGSTGPYPLHGLEYLVCTLYIYENSDPRDTINALRNIASETWAPRTSQGDQLNLPPLPDYRKDLYEVYAGFIRWMVVTTGTIDILCRSWAMPALDKININYPAAVTLPSWIRTVGTEDKRSRGSPSDTLVGLPGQQSYSASYGLRATVAFANGRTLSPHTMRLQRSVEDVSVDEDVSSGVSETPSKKRKIRELSPALILPSQAQQQPLDCSLYVEGITIGRISWATDAITDGVIPNNALRKLRRATADIAPEELWKTLVAERGSDGRNPPSWYYRACRYCLTNQSPNGHLNTDKLLARAQPGIVRMFLQRVQAVTRNRRFIQVAPDWNEWTSSLHGLAPSNAREGDRVCILFGCSVPCVLRPQKTDVAGPHFVLIGEAYVYGLMDGEAISSISSEQLQQRKETFRLL